ncbi:MAG: glycosyltransferase family 39 protein, partial [Flavihumibacter sp.]|nr:glycosyltransferase family 39 protein [Flavihumibacter sp.]
VRFASCCLGVLTILLTYKIVKLYIGKKEALFCALLLTFSTWHIQISRVVMEHVTFTAFFLLSFYLMSKGIKENKKRHMGGMAIIKL